MDSLTHVLKKLKLKGQGGEAVVNAHGKLTLNGNTYQQDEVVILRTYRFEGESDPGDAAIIYVVKANDGAQVIAWMAMEYTAVIRTIRKVNLFAMQLSLQVTAVERLVYLLPARVRSF